MSRTRSDSQFVAVIVAAIVMLLTCAIPSVAQRAVLPPGTLDDSVAQRIDRVFRAAIPAEGPGCAVGVGRNGQQVYAHGYGLANLEYAAPITDSTIFESGSVAKQFTAGALVLLAL